MTEWKLKNGSTIKFGEEMTEEEQDTELDNEMVDFRSLLLQLHTETLKTNRDIAGYLFIIMHCLAIIIAILIGILVSGGFSK